MHKMQVSKGFENNIETFCPADLGEATLRAYLWICHCVQLSTLRTANCQKWDCPPQVPPVQRPPMLQRQALLLRRKVASTVSCDERPCKSTRPIARRRCDVSIRDGCEPATTYVYIARAQFLRPRRPLDGCGYPARRATRDACRIFFTRATLCGAAL